MKKTIFLLFILLPLASVYSADDAPGPLKPRDVTHLVLPRNPSNRPPNPDISIKLEKFFASLQQDKVEPAFKDLFEGNEQLQKRYNTNEFINKTRQALLIYGAATSWELYDNRMVGSRMVALTYFVYLKQVPLRWRFVYYASDGKDWKLINMSVDDLLDQSVLSD